MAKVLTLSAVFWMEILEMQMICVVWCFAFLCHNKWVIEYDVLLMLIAPKSSQDPGFPIS
jgi:hypothetical protein